MNSCNTNHILKDDSYIWIFPPSTTSGYLVILHNSDTIPLPSSASFASAAWFPCLALHPCHWPGPPFPPSPDSTLHLSYYLSTLLTLLPFQSLSLPHLPPVQVPTQCPFPDSLSQHWKGPGAHGDRTQAVSHRRDTRCRQRQLHFSKVPVETGNRAQPALPQSQSSSHTIAAFQTGRHHKDQAEPPHL